MKRHRNDLRPPPKSWTEMLGHPEQEGFQNAAQREYQTLDRRGTWCLADFPSKKTQVIPVTWVFTYKFDTDGFLLKYKARLCVRGDLQPTTKHDNYAATLAAQTFRALMAITAAFDLEAWQLDAINAFTNSELDDLIYCECPDGFREAGKCLLLIRALYGLRKSPQLWLKEFSSSLKELGLQPILEDQCLFQTNRILVFFYVDDIVLLGRKEHISELHKLKALLMQRYEMRYLGNLTWFLGIRVIRDRDACKLWLCQDSYVDKITTTFHLEHAPRASTPLSKAELWPSHETASSQVIYQYQWRIGSLLYPAVITRPDIAVAGSKLSEFLTNPSSQHFGESERCMTYLRDTKTLAIEYSGSATHEANVKIFECASDAAFADEKTTRRSTEGYLFKLYGGAIDWKSTKQRCVTTSTTEAELHALTQAAKEMYWWKRFFTSIRFNIGHEPTIQCDNQQTVGLMKKEAPLLTTKLRHVDIHQHWLRQEVQASRIQIDWVPTHQMPADGLTKPLSRQRHEEFIRQLGLVDISHLLGHSFVHEKEI